VSPRGPATVIHMPQSCSGVRFAGSATDRATIKDTAAEVWSKVSQSDALFLVTDPRGEVIASLGGGEGPGSYINVVGAAAPRFPAQTDGPGSDSRFQDIERSRKSL
jgi:hypothetical protein